MQFILSLMPLWLLRIISPKKAVEIQISRITTKLIRKSFGPFGTVTRKFRKDINKYNADSTPISSEEAMEILVGMVKLAAAQRSLLPALIAEEANRRLFSNRMDRSLQKVVDLAVETDEAYRSTEFVREDYLIEYANFSQNRIQSYKYQGVTPPSKQELDWLKERLDKMNNLTGLGGKKV